MKFYIQLSPNYWDKPPKIKIDVNNDIVWDAYITDNKVIEFTKEIPNDTKAKLNITLYDKTQDQTIVANGKIIKDQLLFLIKIMLDDMDIEKLIYSAKYTVGTEVKNEITVLGQNATWCLEFETPLYMWFLENTFKQT
jgi:hypothetical protein